MSILINVIIISLLVITSISDLKRKRISNRVLIIYGILLLPVLLWRCYQGRWELLKCVPWGVIPGLICLVLGKITREGIGFGDGYLIGIIGMYMGLSKIVGVVIIAFFLIALCSMVLMMIKRVSRKTELPFVPALLVAYGIQHIFLW
ncbi:MAG: prepilin peptidase [Lachnospiraceae bacterium]|nr:prepilin peptidase [Lachnospiraceae bacterium]